MFFDSQCRQFILHTVLQMIVVDVLRCCAFHCILTTADTNNIKSLFDGRLLDVICERFFVSRVSCYTADSLRRLLILISLVYLSLYSTFHPIYPVFPSVHSPLPLPFHFPHVVSCRSLLPSLHLFINLCLYSSGCAAAAAAAAADRCDVDAD